MPPDNLGTSDKIMNVFLQVKINKFFVEYIDNVSLLHPKSTSNTLILPYRKFPSELFRGFLLILLLLILPSAIASVVVNDPTRPIFEKNIDSTVTTKPVVIQSTPLLLQSVFYSKKNKSAIINGAVFKQGETIDGIQLQAVEKRHVVLKYKGQSIKLVISEKVYIDKNTGEKREKREKREK